MRCPHKWEAVAAGLRCVSCGALDLRAAPGYGAWARHELARRSATEPREQLELFDVLRTWDEGGAL